MVTTHNIIHHSLTHSSLETISHTILGAGLVVGPCHLVHVDIVAAAFPAHRISQPAVNGLRQCNATVFRHLPLFVVVVIAVIALRVRDAGLGVPSHY